MSHSSSRFSAVLGGVFALSLVVGVVSASPAFAVTTDSSEEQPVNASVRGGTLNASVFAPALSDVTLDGKTDQVATGVSAPWTLVDARGSGAAWGLSVEGTDFTSDAGAVDSIARTIPIGALTIKPGSITGAAGADANPDHDDITVSDESQPLVWTSASAKGSYTLAPTYDVVIPLGAFRSNFVTGQTGAIHPYVATLTFTIA